MFKSNFDRILVLLLVILLPLERLLAFEVVGFTVKPAYTLAVLIVAWQVIKIISGKIRFRFSLEEYLLLGLIIWSFISSLWSIDYRRTLVMSSLLLLLVLVFIIVRRLSDQKLSETLRQTIVYLGLILSCFAFYQFLIEPVFGYQVALLREQYGSSVFGFPRPEATFIEPLYLANFLIWPIMFLISQISNLKSQKCGRNHLILIIILTAFILTLSRGAYLGLGVGLIVMFAMGIYYKKINWNHWLTIFYGIIIAIGLSLMLVYAVAGKSGVATFRQHAMDTSDMSPQNEMELLQTRAVSQDDAVTQIGQHLILGIGLDAFGALPQYQLLRDSGNWQTVNNQYLAITVELGIIGLILFILFLVLLFRFLLARIKGGDEAYIFYSGAVIALLVQYLTFSSLYLLYIWVMLAIIWPVRSTELKVHPASLKELHGTGKVKRPKGSP